MIEQVKIEAGLQEAVQSRVNEFLRSKGESITVISRQSELSVSPQGAQIVAVFIYYRVNDAEKDIDLDRH